MMYETIILGLLASAAIARPQHGHGHMHKRFHGSGTAAPYPTGGAPFPAGNSTGPFSNTTGVAPPLESTSTVQSVVTRTVVPVAAAASSEAPVEAATSLDANNAAVTGSAATDAAVCDGTPSTTTVTTTELITMTIGEGEAAASTPAAVASSNAPGQFFAPSYSSSSSAAAVAEVAAASTSSSSSAAAVAPTSSEYVAPATTETPTSTVEASTSAASTSSAAAATSSTVSASGSKRGLAYNDVSLTDLWSGQPVSWAYNWGATAGGEVGSGLEYVPMAWCSGSISKEEWTDAANTAIEAGSSHLLGFNEPDQPGQCNIAAADAASGHIDYMNQFSGKAQIGSPAVTNGGGTMGLTYLQSFFDSCDGNCKVDFLNIHWYGSAGEGVVDNFKSHVTSAVQLANKNNISKVWITEFALDGASDTDTASFLGEVLPFLDSQDQVERYAFFMCKDGSLTSGSAISSVIGAAYVA